MSNRRAPVIAAVGSAVLAILLIFFLVLPKRHQVSDAKSELEGKKNQESTLISQRNSLLDAKEHASIAKDQIARVERLLPPTLDQSGIVNFLQNSLNQSTVSWLSATFGTPASAGNFSIVPVQLSVEGTYFELAEFMYQIETFPRAAKVTAITLTSSSAFPILSMQVTMELYTSDISAGPGSEPGPTTPEGSVSVSDINVPELPSPTPSPGS